MVSLLVLALVLAKIANPSVAEAVEPLPLRL